MYLGREALQFENPGEAGVLRYWARLSVQPALELAQAALSVSHRA